MPEEGEDWLMRPVLAKMVRLESLSNGAVSLLDIARANDALDVQAENQTRYEKAIRNG